MRCLAPLLVTVPATALAQTPAISADALTTVRQTLSADAFEGRAPTTVRDKSRVAQ